MKLGREKNIPRPERETDVESIQVAIKDSIKSLSKKTSELRKKFGEDEKLDAVGVINKYYADSKIKFIKKSSIVSLLMKHKRMLNMERGRISAVRDIFGKTRKYHDTQALRSTFDTIGIPYTASDGTLEVDQVVEDCVKQTYKNHYGDRDNDLINNLDIENIDNLQDEAQTMADDMNWMSRINFLKLLLVVVGKFLLLKIAKFICDGFNIEINISLPIIGDKINEFLNRLICILKSTIITSLYFGVDSIEKHNWSFVILPNGSSVNVLNMITTPIADLTKFGRSKGITEEFSNIRSLVAAGAMSDELRTAICNNCIDADIESEIDADIGSALHEILDPALLELKDIVSRCSECQDSGATDCADGLDDVSISNSSALNNYLSMKASSRSDDESSDTMNGVLDSLDSMVASSEDMLNDIGAAATDFWGNQDEEDGSIWENLSGEDHVPISLEDGVGGNLGVFSDILFKIEWIVYMIDQALNAIVNTNGVTLINNIYAMDQGDLTFQDQFASEELVQGLEMNLENSRTSLDLEEQKLAAVDETIPLLETRKAELENSLDIVTGPNQTRIRNQLAEVEESIETLNTEKSDLEDNIVRLEERIESQESDYGAWEERSAKKTQTMEELRDDPPEDLKMLQATVFIILDSICCILNLSAINAYIQEINKEGIDPAAAEGLGGKSVAWYQKVNHFISEVIRDGNDEWLNGTTKLRMELGLKKWTSWMDIGMSAILAVDKNLSSFLEDSSSVETEGSWQRLFIEPIVRALAVIMDIQFERMKDELLGFTDDVTDLVNPVGDDIDEFNETFEDSDGESKTYQEAINEEILAILEDCEVWNFVMDGLKCLLNHIKALLNYIMAAFVAQYGDFSVNIEAALDFNIEFVKYEGFSNIADKISAAWEKILDMCQLYQNTENYIPKLLAIESAMSGEDVSTDDVTPNISDVSTLTLSRNILPVFDNTGSKAFLGDYVNALNGNFVLDKQAYLQTLLGKDYNFGHPLAILNKRMLMQQGIKQLELDNDGNVLTVIPQDIDEVQIGNLTEMLKSLFNDLK